VHEAGGLDEVADGDPRPLLEEVREPGGGEADARSDLLERPRLLPRVAEKFDGSLDPTIDDYTLAIRVLEE
jgi:hypothetical protein